MRSLETRDAEIEKKSTMPDLIRNDDYVDLMKTGRDSVTVLPSTPADSNLPGMVIEAGAHKENVREGSDRRALRSAVPESDSVDRFMEKLGISLNQETDPALLRDILHNDMKLDDCPAVVKLLGSKLDEKESMKPMLETVRESIIAKHPALQEFISTALSENLIPSPDEAGQKLILRSLNQMVLMDAITKGMADDYHVMEDVRSHFMNKRKDMGIREGFLGSTYDIYKIYKEDLFGPAKTKSIDIAFDKLLELRKRGHANEFDSQAWRALLELNLAEAILTDRSNGFSDNARAGIDLALHPFSKVGVSGNNHAVDYNLSQDWDSLYETWNLAFVTGNLTNPNLLLPKLLIPQVIDAKPEEYLSNRILALWLAVNFQLFNKAESKPPIVIPGSKEIAKRWGEINLSYGNRLDKQQSA